MKEKMLIEKSGCLQRSDRIFQGFFTKKILISRFLTLKKIPFSRFFSKKHTFFKVQNFKYFEYLQYKIFTYFDNLMKNLFKNITILENCLWFMTNKNWLHNSMWKVPFYSVFSIKSRDLIDKESEWMLFTLHLYIETGQIRKSNICKIKILVKMCF